MSDRIEDENAEYSEDELKELDEAALLDGAEPSGSSGGGNTKQELLDALRERYPSAVANGLPPRATMIATVVVYVLCIAAVITALAISAVWWVKLVIAGCALIVLVTYNVLYKITQKKKKRERLAYAYAFGDSVKESFESGELAKSLAESTAGAVNEGCFEDMYLTKAGSIVAHGTLSSGRSLSVCFAPLGTDIEIEGKNTFESFCLYYAENGASNGLDRDGYARTSVEKLLGDLSELIRQKADEPDEIPDEE